MHKVMSLKIMTRGLPPLDATLALVPPILEYWARNTLWNAGSAFQQCTRAGLVGVPTTSGPEKDLVRLASDSSRCHTTSLPQDAQIHARCETECTQVV